MPSTGRYAVALQIEDFGKQQETNAFSSIPLQFIVNVVDSTNHCDNKPRIETPVIDIPSNTIYYQTIIARSTGSQIAELNIVSPVGLIKSELFRYGSLNDRWQASEQECKILKIIDAEGCVSNRCSNGASCTQQINGYSCKCEVGFTGIFCETD
ncbi:unnamed protein product [Mytilus coruscus]|uniref:EGF-like domain-containing protein n=1 Tax=Mytilus coruscus TaxID=42192 RepID=A0A6J8D167_MYTCO|nr:unnamed protein product [Mytilus coruscus]